MTKKMLAICACFMLFISCTKDPNAPKEPGVSGKETIHVTGISIDRTSLSLKQGEKVTLTATVSPTNADNKNCLWTSSAPEIATVERGMVTGVKAGVATITVTTEDGGKIANCSVTVERNQEPSVTIGVDCVSAISAILKGSANLGNITASDLKIGFQYSTSAGILPSNSITIEAEEVDADYNYQNSISGLSPDTKYYFRSFVRQNGQDIYGETKEFVTRDASSLIQTESPTDIMPISALLSATIDPNAQCPNKSFGFYYGSEPNNMNHTSDATESEGRITSLIKGLSIHANYYCQAFIIVDGKEYRGNTISFTTKNFYLETLDATYITESSAKLTASINDIDGVMDGSETLWFVVEYKVDEHTGYKKGTEATLEDNNTMTCIVNFIPGYTPFRYEAEVHFNNIGGISGGKKKFTTQ